MCLIIMREPNVVLDKEKFRISVVNNPDGWGISVPDGEGRLFTQKSVTTDWEELYDWIHSEFNEDKIMLHLRYTTAGDTILRNSHPFPVLEKDADGVDLRMAHNGTLHKYSPSALASNSWESDTRVFTRSFVRPLFKRLIKGLTMEDIATDPFIHDLVDTQLTQQSVVTLLDGSGNSMIVNAKGNGGFIDEEGTYFSNKYSHNADHRKPARGAGYTVGKNHTVSTNTGVSTNNTTPSLTSFEDCNTELFSTKYDIKDNQELFFLSDETITTLVEDEQDDAILLIKELLFKLKVTGDKLTKATRVIQKKSNFIKQLETETKKEDEVNVKAA